MAANDERRARPARRSLYVFGALCAGYALALQAQTEAGGIVAASAPASWWMIAGLVLGVVGALSKERFGSVSLLACITCIAAAWFSVRVLDEPAVSLERRIAPLAVVRGIDMPVIVVVTGTVEDEPRRSLPARGAFAEFYRPSPAWRFTMRVDGFLDSAGETHAAAGLARVRVADAGDGGVLVDGEALRAGERIRLHAQARLVSRPMNPGERDWRLWARQDSVAADLHAPDSGLIERVESRRCAFGPWIGGWREAIGSVRTRAARAIGVQAPEEWGTDAGSEHAGEAAIQPTETSTLSGTHPRARALLGAMLLGVRDEHLASVEPAFVRLGLAHLVAISGFNMVLLAGLMAFGVRLLGERGRLEGLLVALAVLGYLLILPAEAPVQRGGVMTLAYIGARALGRRYDSLTVLGWIAVALALYRPMDVFGPGFQLSFGVVAALIAFSGAAYERLFGVRIRGVRRAALPIGPRTRALRLGMMARRGIGDGAESIKYAIAAATVAWAVATPIVLYHTGVLSPMAVLFTLVLSPLFGAALFIGYITMLAGIVLPDSAAWLRPVLEVAGEIIVHVVNALDDLPGASVRAPPLSLVACVLVGCAGVYWLTRGYLRSVRAWAIAAAAIAWLGVELLTPSILSRETALRIDTLAVGDGTCHLLRSGSEAVLWDCGSMNPAAGVRLIPDAVRALGVCRVSMAIVTHANIDHFGALVDASEALGIRRVIVSEPFHRLAGWAEREPRTATRSALAAAALVRELEARGVEVRAVRAGERLDFAHASIEFLWPPANAGELAEVNDTSLVGLVTAATDDGKCSMLLTGDIGVPAIRGLLAGPPGRLPAILDVLELPHHGSFNAEVLRLVERLKPRVVLQSTGGRRALSRSWDELQRQPGAPIWYTTARDGAAFVEIERDGSNKHGAYRGERTRAGERPRRTD